MTDYVKIADYAAKDALAPGELAKVIRGTELGAEFDAIAVAIATKYDATDLGVTLQAYAIPAGTAMLFYADAAPTGWTRVVGIGDDTALRIVTGTGAGGSLGGDYQAGTNTFSQAFGAAKSTGAYSLLAADLPSHAHTYSGTTSGQSATHTHGNSTSDQGTTGANALGFAGNTTARGSTGNASNDHTHTYSGTTSSIGSGTAHSHTINFDVRYASFIVASKD